MEVELIEIRQFLEQLTPFSYLTDELLDELPQAMEVRYLRRESKFPPAKNYLYVVRSGAIELHNDHGELCEKLAEGSIYSATCQLIDLSVCGSGKAAEDTLLYALPCDKLKQLCQKSDLFNQHFSASVKDRLKKAVTLMQEDGLETNDVAVMTVEVGTLVRKQPVVGETTLSIRDTATLMSERDVSSVLIMENDQLAGIVTDRDLRKRCISQGVSIDSPISTVMTADPVTISHNALSSQALMTMTRLHAHHLPVMRQGKVIGMITANDLAKQQSTNSAFVATDIRKAKSVDDLVVISRRLPLLQMKLSTAGVSAHHVGEAISSITDSITMRLIEMAEAELGEAPIPYVWLAGGSQGRHEQSSHSDQDNALLLSNEFKPEHESYFEQLAKFVCDGLNACGFVYCPGEAMAMNPKWRQPLDTWKKYFHSWIDSPDPMALMLSSIWFDLRPVVGSNHLFTKLQSEILNRTQDNGIFLAYMAANAMQHRPPLGFFRSFVLEHGGDHDDTLDLKHRGIVPITDLARVMALAQGVTSVNTEERLEAVSGTPAMSEEMSENLQDALEFIASLRIRHQADQIRSGQDADNYLNPDHLSQLERDHLKDAFKIIQTMQESMVKRYQAERLG